MAMREDFRPTQNEKNQQFKTKIRFSFDHKAFAKVPLLPFEGLNLKEEKKKMLRVT